MPDFTTYEYLLHDLNIELSEKQKNQFLKFYELLVEKNKVMNLTAITEFEEVVIKHFIDSLSLCKVYIINGDIKIIDLGTGAGFPGIPLKIVYPECEMVLLDSLNKRVKFLNDVIKELGLNNITAIHGRAEDYGNNTMYREKFDLCVSRAVANLSTLSEYCIPFVKPSGYFVPYKAGKIEDELTVSTKAIKALGGIIENTIDFRLPKTDIDRTLIKIKKVTTTPSKYPRGFGKPAKEPIK